MDLVRPINSKFVFSLTTVLPYVIPRFLMETGILEMDLVKDYVIFHFNRFVAWFSYSNQQIITLTEFITIIFIVQC